MATSQTPLVVRSEHRHHRVRPGVRRFAGGAAHRASKFGIIGIATFTIGHALVVDGCQAALLRRRRRFGRP